MQQPFAGALGHVTAEDSFFNCFIQIAQKSDPYTCFPSSKTRVQEVEVPGQQDLVSCDHAGLFDNLARPSLWIHPVFLHGVLYYHCGETGMPSLRSLHSSLCNCLL